MGDEVAPRRRWRAWLVGFIGLAGACYGAAGFAMAGSFSVAQPERLAHGQRAAIIYLALVAVSLALLAGAAVALLRGRGRRPDRRDRAV